MSEKPFGWRPFSDEYRQTLRDSGLGGDAIDAMEAENTYKPVEDAVLAREFALALLNVVARRHGAGVIADFRSILEQRTAKFEVSEYAEDQVEAKILREALDNGVDWEALTARASDPDHADWTRD